MKKTLLTVLVLLTTFMTAELAYTYSNSAPPSGYANDPGMSNCTDCHTSYPLATGGPTWNNITLTSSVPLSQFQPNLTYTLNLSFSDVTSIKYGFEMVALPSGADPTSSSIGILTPLDPQTEVNSLGSRDYISHSALGTSALSHSKTWTFQWETPTSYMGGVDFYVVVNSTNNDGTNSFDRIYAKVFSSTILPVKWLSYEVKTEKAGNHIKWSTASEVNNLQFDIEKSFDASEWTKLASVKAKGNSNQVTQYEYLDQLKTTVKTYYRIKQIDMDGKYEYSKVLFAEPSGSASESFAYDPLTNKITITSPSLMARATLFNLSGAPVCDDMYGQTLNVEAVDKGIYVLKLPSGNYQKVYIY